MTEVPDLTNHGQGQPTVELDENNSVTMPDVANPPTWLTLKDLYRKTIKIGHFKGDREAGFDLTSFGTPETFVEMLESIDIDPYYDYARVNVTRAEFNEEYYHYVWGNERGMIVLGNNPITGEYRDGNYKREGYASYIGLEGTQDFVESAFQMIIQYSSSYKDYDMSRRSFI